MRTCDLETSGRVWAYRPEGHKTSHHGHGRVIYLGPRAQAVLRPWLRPDLMAYLFQPREAEAERQADRRERRRTPLTPSQRARTRKARPRRSPGGRYDARTYAHAVTRACDRAFPHPTLGEIPTKELTPELAAELAEWRRRHRWHPHQLRHNAATRLRREFDVDTARAVLGHATPVVTEIYAELDATKAAEAMERVG
jgi:integrase